MSSPVAVDPTSAGVPVVDLLDPHFYVDLDRMHQTFTRLRQQNPVYRDEVNGLWGVTRHADVLAVERRSRAFATAHGHRSPPGAGGESLINLDDPEHSARRRMVAKYFVPRTIATLEARVRATVDELMAPALDRGQMEVVSELAGPLPSRTIAPIIGLPEDRWVDIRRWSEVLMRFENSSVHPTAWDDAIAVMHEFGELLERTIPERAGLVDGNDLLTLWANAEGVGCPMDPATMIDEVGLFVGGGAETTRTVISRGLAALCEHPDQWRRLKEDPSLIPLAVEELIRWVTPLNNMFRTVTTDGHIGPQPVSAGDRVILLYPSANRDEGVFDDSFRLDVGRTPNPHLSFGHGTHFCIGAHLARLETRVVLEQFVDRVAEMSADRCHLRGRPAQEWCVRGARRTRA